MKEEEIKLVEVSDMTEAEAMLWAEKNEGSFAFGDNGGAIQMFTAHFYEEGKEPKPQDEGIVISMCNEVCDNEVQIIITDFNEIKRLSEYLVKAINKHKENIKNDENNPCHGCCSINECKQICCGKRKCDKYIKCPF